MYQGLAPLLILYILEGKGEVPFHLNSDFLLSKNSIATLLASYSAESQNSQFADFFMKNPIFAVRDEPL